MQTRTQKLNPDQHWMTMTRSERHALRLSQKLGTTVQASELDMPTRCPPPASSGRMPQSKIYRRKRLTGVTSSRGRMCLKFHALASRLHEIAGDSQPPFLGLLHASDASTANRAPTPRLCRMFGECASLGPAPRAAQQLETPGLLCFGETIIETWYDAPLPSTCCSKPVLYVCPRCLDYTGSETVHAGHKRNCTAQNPPGNEILRQGSLSLFEVDGARAAIYCRNLCMLAKLFLNSKTLYQDVEYFFFYVLTDTQTGNFLGYFSKQRIYCYHKAQSPINCLSCIVVLPLSQGRGYGQLLIELSYLLARRQRVCGSPEKPLSDLGLRTFEKYWTCQLARAIQTITAVPDATVTIDSLAELTGIAPDDAVYTLEMLGWLKPDLRLEIDKQRFAEAVAEYENRPEAMRLDEKNLVWAPLYMGPL